MGARIGPFIIRGVRLFHATDAAFHGNCCAPCLTLRNRSDPFTGSQYPGPAKVGRKRGLAPTKTSVFLSERNLAMLRGCC